MPRTYTKLELLNEVKRILADMLGRDRYLSIYGDLSLRNRRSDDVEGLHITPQGIRRLRNLINRFFRDHGVILRSEHMRVAQFVSDLRDLIWDLLPPRYKA